MGSGYYRERATQLAARELIYLALSVRRLAELTTTEKNLKSENISTYDRVYQPDRFELSKGKSHQNIWKIVGTIIHSRNITLLNDSATFNAHFSTRRMSIDELYDTYSKTKDINAICIVNSDSGESIILLLYELISKIQSYTDIAEDVLSDNKIYVGLGFE